MAHVYAQVRRWTLLTDLGVLVVAGGFVLLRFYGIPRSDFVAQMAGAGALGLVALGLLSVLFGVAVVSLRGTKSTSSEVLAFEAGRGHAEGESWPSTVWPLVDVEVRVLAPEGLDVSHHGAFERLEARHRTAGGVIERALIIEDAFGLVRAELRRRQSRPVRVGPFLGHLDGAPALRALAPGASRGHPFGRPAGDRVEMRPYVAGDPLRLVLWKTYARTGGLYVRTPERALDEEVEVHAHLVAGWGDEAAAASAWVAVTRGLLGPRWTFGADGSTDRTRDVDAAQSMISASRRARKRGGQLDGVVAEAHRSAGARLVLFVPCRSGPWLDATANQIRAVADRTTVVITHDTLWEHRAKRGWVRAADRKGEGSDARPPPEAVDAIVQTFSRLGISAVRVDRETGRAENTAHPGRAA